jgi:hypothetical protein
MSQNRKTSGHSLAVVLVLAAVSVTHWMARSEWYRNLFLRPHVEKPATNVVERGSKTLAPFWSEYDILQEAVQRTSSRPLKDGEFEALSERLSELCSNVDECVVPASEEHERDWLSWGVWELSGEIARQHRDVSSRFFRPSFSNTSPQGQYYGDTGSNGIDQVKDTPSLVPSN